MGALVKKIIKPILLLKIKIPYPCFRENAFENLGVFFTKLTFKDSK